MKPKLSAVFRAAKKKLWDGTGIRFYQSLYICYAINNTRFNVEIKREARDVILSLLCESATLEHWLRQHHNIDGRHNIRKIRKLQQTRHAWLDHLIEHYESIGD